ncbi:MAG: patatin-like phospholipase family protein [Planctomycetes bacterium]|nr:patatin-like phospholipase family protein [Planctomycetota bacterium]
MTTGPDRFFAHPDVVGHVAQARAAARCDAGGVATRAYSDTVDDAGHQYVDLVMEGGGVLGIALLGYTYVLEQVGLRFLGIGGTSAGAINATLLAAAADPADPRSERIVGAVAAAPIRSFFDGDGDAQDLTESLLAGRHRKGLIGLAAVGLEALQVVDNLKKDLGLHPGDRVAAWLDGVLAGFGVTDTRSLGARLARLPRIHHRRTGATLLPTQTLPCLRLVAADITTETRAILPEMAELYWPDAEHVPLSRFVRASMSIPFAFAPVRARPPARGRPQDPAWTARAGWAGVVPDEVLFVDGGIVSNFPIDVFHEPGVPIAPTFGVKLGRAEQAPNPVTSGTLGAIGNFAAALLNAARHQGDDEFILDNPDYRHLVAAIDTGDHFWLDFGLTDDARVDLFARGAGAAAEFLARFDWDAYRELRAGLGTVERKASVEKPSSRSRRRLRARS